MGTIQKLIFPVHTLEKNTEQVESLVIELQLPSYYNSETLRDKSNFVIHRGFQTERTNQRQGTVSTKTRAEVRGGGRKPWQQKGSGRARAGSTRSPLWKGGGVCFGPKPKKYYKKLNKKEWRLGLRLLLAKKKANIVVLKDLEITSVKTKDILEKMNNFGVKTKETCLIIVPKIFQSLQLSTQNLPNIKIMQANNLSIQSLLKTKNLIFTKESLKLVEEIYNA